MFKIRASALKPGDVIHEEVYGHPFAFLVSTAEQNREDTPRTVTVGFLQKDRSTTRVTIPWDRRLLVERSDSPSGGSESNVEATTPSTPSTSSLEASKSVPERIAEAREEFIAKVRKIIREG